MGDWVEGSAPATITDFDSSEDVLAYAYDTSGPPPSLSVQYTYDGSGNVDESLLFSNGHLVVRVTSTGNALTLSDVILTSH